MKRITPVKRSMRRIRVLSLLICVCPPPACVRKDSLLLLVRMALAHCRKRLIAQLSGHIVLVGPSEQPIEFLDTLSSALRID